MEPTVAVQNAKHGGRYAGTVWESQEMSTSAKKRKKPQSALRSHEQGARKGALLCRTQPIPGGSEL